MIVYPIGTSGQKVVLADSVVEHLRRNRQLKRGQPEAGGQLFARIEGAEIVVVEATGPRRTDRRTRTTYLPDRNAEQAEIIERHARGLHFVGDWHTHPDARPQPSHRDLESMTECFANSAHCLKGFLLLIAGQADPPGGFSLTIHDGSTYYVLAASQDEPRTGGTDEY
jgi:integrative and conjugative element protein (TIGR02256 family)